MKPKIKHTTLLFFGSFNPVHLAHISIAEFVQKKLKTKETLFVLSPQNPFKTTKELLPFDIRFELLHAAKKDFPFLSPCDIEKKLPQPSYTCETIKRLKEKFSNTHFFLLIGTDNFSSFHLWKQYEYILKNVSLVVYPRNNNPILDNPILDNNTHQIIFLSEAPRIEISSSMVRKKIENKEKFSHLLPQSVSQKIKQFGLYK